MKMKSHFAPRSRVSSKSNILNLKVSKKPAGDPALIIKMALAGALAAGVCQAKVLKVYNITADVSYASSFLCSAHLPFSIPPTPPLRRAERMVRTPPLDAGGRAASPRMARRVVYPPPRRAAFLYRAPISRVSHPRAGRRMLPGPPPLIRPAGPGSPAAST